MQHTVNITSTAQYKQAVKQVIEAALYSAEALVQRSTATADYYTSLNVSAQWGASLEADDYGDECWLVEAMNGCIDLGTPMGKYLANVGKSIDLLTRATMEGQYPHI